VQDTGLGEQAGLADGGQGGLEQGDVVAVGAVDGPAADDPVERPERFGADLLEDPGSVASVDEPSSSSARRLPSPG